MNQSKAHLGDITALPPEWEAPYKDNPAPKPIVIIAEVDDIQRVHGSCLTEPEIGRWFPITAQFIELTPEVRKAIKHLIQS